MSYANSLPAHPGKILLNEFLIPLRVFPDALASSMSVPAKHVTELIEGSRDVEAKLAWLLADALNTSPQFWMNLQMYHDLAKVRR